MNVEQHRHNLLWRDARTQPYAARLADVGEQIHVFCLTPDLATNNPSLTTATSLERAPAGGTSRLRRGPWSAV